VQEDHLASRRQELGKAVLTGGDGARSLEVECRTFPAGIALTPEGRDGDEAEERDGKPSQIPRRRPILLRNSTSGG
jgi:hypothetical protein